MKKLSIKVKLTLLYTACMVFVIGVIFSILFSISNKEVLAYTQMNLKNRVQESMDEIEWKGEKWKIDSDFYQVEDNIYLAMYDENSDFLYGKVPSGFTQPMEFSSDEVRRIEEEQKAWYVYDLQLQLKGRSVYFRGITSVTDAEENFLITIRIALILLPLTVLVVGILVYRMARRTLLPVKTITETVQEIRQDADLSKRVGLYNKGSEKRNRDEIAYLAQTFDEMLEELEKVFKREKQFTSDVSHELRTPVSVILAQCETCLSDDSFNEQQHKQVELIQRKAQTMAEMISHLLLLSRADQGRLELHLEHVNVSELLKMIVEEQQILAEEHDITIQTRIEPDLYAQLDETLYIRMMDNLISNAVTYGKENGIIEVTLMRGTKGLWGTVKDDGIGIANEHLPHIWERFYRMDTSRAGGNHSGLGLAMVKWIVEMHGGSIKAESVLEKGTIFTYVFPQNEKN